MLIALIINISSYLPVSLQKGIFSVLVIWIEREEQVECRCAFEGKGMIEVYFKVKPWNGDRSSQYWAISYYQTLLFFSFQLSSTSQYVVYFLCFCAGTNTVGFITLLESVEKSSFSVTALLLLLIFFYYSFHFL